MSLKHLAVPERKQGFKQKPNDGGMSKGHKSQMKDLSVIKIGTI